MKLKHYTTLLVPACLITFVLRAVELILSIDPNTRQFTTHTVFPTVFNIVLLVMALFFATVLFTKTEPKPATVRLARPSLFDVIIGVGTAMALISASAFSLILSIAEGTLPLNDLFSSGDLWQAVLAVGAAFFIIFYVTYPKRSVKRDLWRFLSLFLSGYTLFLLIRNFTDMDVVFSRSFGIYVIIFYGMAAAASISLSKIMARLIGRKPFVLFTCLMAIFMSLRMADTVLYLIPGNPYAIPCNLFHTVADLLLTLLYISQMKKLLKGKKRPRPVEAETPAEEASSEVSAEATEKELPEQPQI